ncbi:MAG TPA: hypothetical protein PLH94_06895 [Fimbriimonadaceae bacterium]|nr:hypothetical protein [Fimbriimonadaceae bacterium]
MILLIPSSPGRSTSARTLFITSSIFTFGPGELIVGRPGVITPTIPIV